MNNDTTKQVIGKYSDQEKDLIKRFHADTELYEFVRQNLLTGVTGTETDEGKYPLTWMNQVAVKHIGVKGQAGMSVDSEAFTREATAKFEGIGMIEEIFARYDIVANFKEEEPKTKKAPSLK